MTLDKVGAVGGAAATSALEPSAKTSFSQVWEGTKGAARPRGPPVATEGAPRAPAPERQEVVRGACEARGRETAVAGTSEARTVGRMDSVQAAREQQAVRMLDRVGEAQQRMDHILALAESGRSFSATELMAFQAQVYRASQELDLAGKVVEKATGGVKQVLQTQV
jgi:hypothetical protein